MKEIREMTVDELGTEIERMTGVKRLPPNPTAREIDENCVAVYLIIFAEEIAADREAGLALVRTELRPGGLEILDELLAAEAKASNAE